MPLLPSLITRPLLDPPPSPPAAAADRRLRRDLDAGLPARIDLDPTRSLVLGVPLGRARAVLAADPLAVAFDAGSPADPARPRDTGGAWPRLTLVVSGSIGESVPVVAGVTFRLGVAGTAAVAITVDRLVVTFGSLRSPGRFGSLLALTWTDLGLGSDTGPPPATGDPSVPRAFLPGGP